MTDIEPFYGWRKYYISNQDVNSPFYGTFYSNPQNNQLMSYSINPDWRSINSETLFCEILFSDYINGFCIIEMFGEWNDALNNDIMYLKSIVFDKLTKSGINKFILICENVFQYHGGDVDYYEELEDDLNQGWIVLMNLPQFLYQEFKRVGNDQYLNYGQSFEVLNWRTFKPFKLYLEINDKMRFLLN